MTVSVRRGVRIDATVGVDRHAGRGLHPPEKVLEEIGVGVGRLGVPERGVEDSTLALLPVPGDGQLGGAAEGVAAQVDEVGLVVLIEDVELVFQREGEEVSPGLE